MQLIGPFIYGIGTGFLMSVLLGVIFFMLIQAGINHGWKKGATIAAGVITGDIFFVVLAISFTAYIYVFLANYENVISIIGGAVLLIMGIASFYKKRQNLGSGLPVSKFKNARDFYLKPLFINLVNPANAVWWLGLYSMPPALGYATDQKVVFAIGALITVFFTEIGVAATASKLKKFISQGMVKRIDQGVGVVLFIVGLRLLAKGLNWF